MYEIEFINSTVPTVRDCPEFETVYAEQLKSVDCCDDIGGLIVYTCKDAVVAVFDYENECAWVV